MNSKISISTLQKNFEQRHTQIICPATLEILNSPEFQSYVTTNLNTKKILKNEQQRDEKYLKLLAKYCFSMKAEQQKTLLSAIIEKYFYQILDVMFITGIHNKLRLAQLTKIDNIADLIEEELAKHKKLKENKNNTIELFLKNLLPEFDTLLSLTFFICHPTGILFALNPNNI